MSQHKVKTQLKLLDGEMLDHLHLLRCADIAAYQNWCQTHGFSSSLKKNWKQRARELFDFREQSACKKMQQQKREKRQPVEMIKAICRGNCTSPQQFHQPFLKTLCHLLKRNRSARKLEQFDPQQFQKVLVYLYECRTRFFETIVPYPQLGMDQHNTFLSGLAHITLHRDRWLRPLETWKPHSKNAHKQFASLLRHLFVKYDDVPEFFDAVWFSTQEEGPAQREWYLHVGRGKNLRDCKLPIPLTKKMAHHVMHAPARLTVKQALRWGQVRGLGGSELLAEVLAATRLGEHFEQEDFWLTVIRWLIDYPDINPTDIGPMIDYLHYQRHVPEVQHLGQGIAAPPQPNLSMRGRTPETLLRRVDEWHRLLGKQNAIQQQEWPACGLRPLEILEGSVSHQSLKTWRIRELLCTRSLVAEGRQMNHCVAIYAHSCANGHSSIWTMECATMTGLSKLLTIEVSRRTRSIVQVRGKANRLATAEEMKIVSHWAERESLTIGRYL